MPSQVDSELDDGHDDEHDEMMATCDGNAQGTLSHVTQSQCTTRDWLPSLAIGLLQHKKEEVHPSYHTESCKRS